MTYETFLNFAPNTGYAASEVNIVHNNPNVSTSQTITWPNKYDAFVTKQNAGVEAFTVIDEEHYVSDINTSDSNSLYLYHKILPPGTASGLSNVLTVSDGVISTGLVDYANAKIHFSTMPTGTTVEVSYLAQPDPISAKHMNVLQNGLMKLQQVIGAGTTENQGFKNVKFLIIGDELTGSASSYLPNAIPSNEFQETSLIIAGESGITHSIILGNTYDTISLKGSSVHITSSGGFGSATGSFPVPNNDNAQFIVDQDCYIRGQSTFGSLWPAANIGTWSTSGEYTGAASRFLGNVFIAGNLVVTGSQTIVNSTINVTGSVYSGSLTVSGSATIHQNLTVNGASSLNGLVTMQNATVSGDLFIGRRINFLNSQNSPSIIDGLDPSYISDTLIYSRKDPNLNSVVSCYFDPITFTEWYDPLGGTSFTGSRTTVLSGQVISKATGASGNYLYTSIRLPYQPIGIYEDSIFDGEAICRWNTGPLMGRESLILKAISLNDSSGYSTGSMIRLSNESHYTNSAVSNQLELYLPGYKYCSPAFIDAPTKPVSDPVVTVSATNANPLVINVNGQIRRIVGTNINVNMTPMLQDTSTYPNNGTVTGFLYTRSVGNLYESEYNQSVAFYMRPYYANLPDEIILGEIEFTRSAGNWGTASDWEVKHYAVDSFYDSGWIMSFAGIAGRPATHGVNYVTSITGWGHAHNGTGPDSFAFSSVATNSKHIVIEHNLGDMRKLDVSDIDIYIATTYWNTTSETLSDTKNDLLSNTLRKHMFKLTSFEILKQTKNAIYISFNIPTNLTSMWNSATWSEYIIPNSGNNTRAFVRFIIRPRKQTTVR